MSTSCSCQPRNLGWTRRCAASDLLDVQGGYANFEAYSVSMVPTMLGNLVLKAIFQLRFTSPSIAAQFWIDSDQFVLATDPVNITVVRQPTQAAPGLALAIQPLLSVQDKDGMKAGWYAINPVRITATVCVAIDSIFGSYDEVGGRKGTPVFRCYDDVVDFCSVQEQTPLLLRPVIIPSPRLDVKGTLYADAEDGMVAFTDIRLDKWGTYRLRFDAPGFKPTFSDPFSVVTSAGVLLHVLVQPGGAVPGSALNVQPTIAMHDRGGNVVTAVSGFQLTASLTLPGGDSAAPAKLQTANDNTMLTVATMQYGVCAFQGLRVDTVGTYVMRFVGGGVTPVNSLQFRVDPSPPVRLRFATGPLGCRFGVPCATQPVIEMVDAGGNVADSSATISALWTPVSLGLCPAEKAGRTYASYKGRSIFDGLGLSTAAGAGSCDGRYTLIVSSEAAGLAPASWSGVIVSGDPVGLSVTVSPANAFPGLVWEVQTQGLLVDSLGRRVSSATAVVGASLLDCGGGTGCVLSSSSLIGTPSVTTTFGAVTFTDLRLDVQKTCYRVQLSSPPLASSITYAFDVQPSTFIAHVAVLTQPSDTTAGMAFPTQPVVSAMDKGANIMNSYSSSVSALVIFGDADVGGLLGTRTVQFKQGIGTFTNLQVNLAACCLALKFQVSSGLITGYSQNFCSHPAAPAKLAFSVSPSGALPGLPLQTQPVLAMLDSYDNPVTARTCRSGCSVLSANVTAELGPTAPLLGDTLVGFVGGVATFTSLRIDEAGTHALSFSTVSPFLLSPVGPTILTCVPAIDRATKLIIIQQPYGFAGTVAGRHISIQPRVAIADIGGNVITRASTVVSVALLGSVTGSWLRGTTNVATVDGIANFTDLRLGPSPDGPGLNLLLQFTSDPKCTSGADYCTSVNSVRFDMAGAVSSIKINTQPSSGVAGQVLPVMPSVSIYDASLRLYSYFGTAGPDVLYISLVNGTIVNGTDMTLFGNSSALYTNAKASWTDLYLNKAGDYVLRFSLTAVTNEFFTVDSVKITVNPANATSLRIGAQPQFASPGLAFGLAPSVSVVDMFGNIVTTWSRPIVARLNQGGVPSATLLRGTGSQVPVNGTAVFSSLGLNTSGNAWSITFSSDGVTGATTNPVNMSSGTRVFSLDLTSSMPLVSAGPGGMFDGFPFLFQPVVRLLDLGGNVIASGNTTNVMVSLVGGSGGAFNLSSASGSSFSSAPRGGIVAFTDLVISGWGNANGDLFLLFTHSLTYQGPNGTTLFENVSVQSAPISVSRNASVLSAATSPSSSNLGGQLLIKQPVIQIVDSKGVLVVNQWAGPTQITATLIATGNNKNPSEHVTQHFTVPSS